jgi:hypothetical protein
MAVGWMTALKLVPWGDVIEAAPQIAQAAGKLLRRPGKAPQAIATPAPGASAQEQLDALRQQLARLEEEQRASAALIESMAGQQAQLVAAVGALRTGALRLAWACAVLLACVVVLAVARWI